jgi:hypothetical protein
MHCAFPRRRQGRRQVGAAASIETGRLTPRWCGFRPPSWPWTIGELPDLPVRQAQEAPRFPVSGLVGSEGAPGGVIVSVMLDS